MSSPAERVIAFLRARVLAAVLMPGLLGAAFSVQRGFFSLPRFLPVMAGLAIAETLSLLGADYQMYRSSKSGMAEPALPGTPLLPLSVWGEATGPVIVLCLGLLGIAILAYMTVSLGPGLLVFVGFALFAGYLYAAHPFPYSYLSTAALPPVITAGTHYALAGTLDPVAFLIGLPVGWISVGVILGYRILFRDGTKPSRRQAFVVLFFYALCPVSVILLVITGVYPPLASLSLVPVVFFLFVIGRILYRGSGDHIPLTAWGVSMHSVVPLMVAGFFVL